MNRILLALPIVLTVLAVVAVALLGMFVASVGAAQAQTEAVTSTACQATHDLNIDVLGEVGVLNGVTGNALGGEGNPGAQVTQLACE